MLTMPSRKITEQRKCTSVSISDKLKITEMLQAEVLVAKVYGKFHVAKQTVCDIKKNKNNVKHFTHKFGLQQVKVLCIGKTQVA